jgi:hypothetical protein
MFRSNYLGNNSRSVSLALSVLFLAVIFTCLKMKILFSGILEQDEGGYLTYPDLVLRGLLPIIDFSVSYPPGNIFIISTLFSFFGESLWIERIVGHLYQCALLISIFLLGNKFSWASGFLGSIACLIFLVLFPAAGAFPIFPCLFLACVTNILLLEYYITGEEKFVFLAGVLCGFIFWLRLEIGFVCFLANLVWLFPFRRIILFSYLKGVLLPLLPLFGYFAYADITKSYTSLILDVSRMMPGRRLPIEHNIYTAWLFIEVLASILIVILINRKMRASALFRLSLITCFLSVALLPSTLQRADVWHITYIQSFLTPLLLICYASYTSPKISPKLALSITLIVTISITSIDFFKFAGALNKVQVNERWVYYAGDKPAAELNELLNELNSISSDGESIFVGPDDLRFAFYNDTFIYFLLPKLKPSSKFLEMNPGVANQVNSGLDKEILSSDWIILTSKHSPPREPNMSSIPIENNFNSIINQNFCLLKKLGYWELFKKCNFP